MKYVLDASVIIDLIYNSDRVQKIKDKLKDELLMTTAPTLHEVLEGANEKQQFIIKNLLEGMTVLPFTQNEAVISADIAQTLAREGKTINKIDLLVSGICIAHDAIIVSFDNDFNRVKNLKILEI